MKPNDKAYEAAVAEGKLWKDSVERKVNQIPYWKVLRQADDGYDGYDVIAKFNSPEERDKALERLRAEAMVNAAYAAQFKSEDCAELVKELRSPAMIFYEYSADKGSMIRKAADALEAVLAERDDFAEQLALRSESGMAKDMQEIMRINNELLAERDALLARIAPVEDEALVEIGAKEMAKPPFHPWEKMSDTDQQRTKMALRAAIAAVRPHIEAAEREKLREDIKSRFAPKSAQQIRNETDRLIEKHRESVRDWLEAGSWKQSGGENDAI